MSFEFNPAEEDPHGECRHEIERLQQELKQFQTLRECKKHHDVIAFVDERTWKRCEHVCDAFDWLQEIGAEGKIYERMASDAARQVCEIEELEAKVAHQKPAADKITAEQLAQQFHELYEDLAPSFGYETRRASRKPWSEVPSQNKNLMIAVCVRILKGA